MKKLFLLIFLIVFSISNLFANERYEPGVILIQLKNPDVVQLNQKSIVNGSQEFQNTLDKHAIQNSRKRSHVNRETDGWYRLEFPVKSDLKIIRSDLIKCDDIQYALFNNNGVLYSEPDDPHYQSGEQWALEKIQTPMAWDVTKSDETILVGIIDSGIEYAHEDLSINIWSNPGEIPGDGSDNDNNRYTDDIKGWDFVNNDNDPLDEAGWNNSIDYHGTQVAGIVAAKTYNAIGVAGIAGGWLNQLGVRLIPLKFVGATSYQYDAAEAINYLTWLRQQGHVVVANMSFGFEYLDDNEVIDLKQAIEAARDEGVILVAAAGNKSNDPKSPYYNIDYVEKLPAPARWEGVIAIGASANGTTFQGEQKSPYSLYDQQFKLHIVAPVNDYINGININTTYYNDDYVDDFSGTSAACPMVVGVIANLLSIKQDLTYQAIENIFARTAEKIGGYYYYDFGDGKTKSLEVGYGRLNAYKALKYTVEHYGGMYNNDFTIATGEVFNLEPGITLKFASNTSLIVYGTLNANGTSSNKITFTSASSTPQKGDWEGIIFDNAGSSSSIQYCTIEYAVRGINTNATNLTIEYSDINNNSGNGIKCHEASPTIT